LEIVASFSFLQPCWCLISQSTILTYWHTSTS
jgi:hypothetical protein